MNALNFFKYTIKPGQLHVFPHCGGADTILSAIFYRIFIKSRLEVHKFFNHSHSLKKPTEAYFIRFYANEEL